MHDHAKSPLKTYFAVWGALLLGTYLTYKVAFIDLGPFNPIIALVIATTKALLVALFFMHVRHSTKLTQVVLLGGLLWFGILMGKIGRAHV